MAVQGLGSVGWALCEMLHADGAELVVTDIDTARAGKARQAFGAEIVPADRIVAAEADVLAPCALGAVISAETVPMLKAGIVAGAANNQLARHGDAALLMERGVLYAPDYVINGGGLINVASELDPDGYDRDSAMAKVARIPEILGDVFRRAEAEGRPTNDIAQAMARERLAAARPAG